MNTTTTTTVPADQLRLIALDRLGLLATPTGPTTPEVATATLAELAHAGIRVTNPERVPDSLAPRVPTVVRHTRRRRGERDIFTPLFAGFPDQLPASDVGWLRFLLAGVRLAGRTDVYDKAGELTDTARREALDFTDLGWWPASSVPQDVEQTELDRARETLKPADTRIEWVTVELVDDADLDTTLKAYMADCFTSAASLREDVKADVELLARHYGVADIDATAVRFRENRTLLLKLAWETDPRQVQQLDATPDDLLRMFAALTGGDVSLTEPIRFPTLTRAQRRAVVNTLESSDRLGEIFRRRGLWLALDRGLHLGEFTAPKAQEAFGRLRDSRHDVTSFGSRFEQKLTCDYPAAVKLAAVEAPGVLGRSIRRLAYLAGTDPDRRAAFVASLADAAEWMPMRVLLAARGQVADNGATYLRVVFGKTGQMLPIDNPAGHLSVDAALRQEILDVLDAALGARAAERGTWAGQRIYIDPKLGSVLVPDQLRSTAQGLVQVERGTRLPLGEANVVRLFVHWRQQSEEDRSDLDLSCLALDADFNPVGQVSWTNLANGAMTHSGDLTSAPVGAQEFIDIDLAAAREAAAGNGWRYLVPTVLRYDGPAFGALAEAHVGWMLREKCSSDRRTFDPATVVNAFALTGGKRTAVPMLVDLDTNEVLYVDVYLNGAPYAMLERDGVTVATAVSAVAARSRTKASVADLADLHLAARGGTRVATAEEATVTFGLDDGCTYNALRPEKVLADLL